MHPGGEDDGRSDSAATRGVVPRARDRRSVVDHSSVGPASLGTRGARLGDFIHGPLARSLALVSIVIGGLMFMFGEGGAKRQISGIVFGGGLALFAAQFLTWLY